MKPESALTHVPTTPPLVRRRVAGVAGITRAAGLTVGAGLAGLACGDRTDTLTTPPLADATAPDARQGATSNAADGGLADATVDVSYLGAVDAGFGTGFYDATGRSAADAIADAASDGHIFDPPCGIPP